MVPPVPLTWPHWVSSGWRWKVERQGERAVGKTGWPPVPLSPSCPVALHLSLLVAGGKKPDRGRLSLSPAGKEVWFYFNFSFLCYLSAALTSVNLRRLLELSRCYLSPRISAERGKKTIPLKRRWVKEKATWNSQPMSNLGLLLFVRVLKIPWAIFCFCSSLSSCWPHFQAVLCKGTSSDSLTAVESFGVSSLQVEGL